MKKPKVLLIGASSLIGSHIYRALVESDYQVTGTYFSCRSRELSHLDVTDSEQLVRFVNESDLIINCSALAGREKCDRNPEMAMALNVRGTFNIAYQCRLKKKRLIQFSSASVLNDSKTLPHSESENPDSRLGDEYNQTKGICERIVESLVDDLTLIRLTYTYGVKSDDCQKLGGDLFRTTYERLRDGEEVMAYDKTPTNPTYLPDIGRALLKIISSDYGGRINLGGEQVEIVKFFEMIKKTFRLAGNVRIGSSSINRALDLSKMHQLGIHMNNLNQGLESLLELAPYLRL